MSVTPPFTASEVDCLISLVPAMKSGQTTDAAVPLRLCNSDVVGYDGVTVFAVDYSIDHLGSWPPTSTLPADREIAIDCGWFEMIGVDAAGMRAEMVQGPLDITLDKEICVPMSELNALSVVEVNIDTAIPKRVLGSGPPPTTTSFFHLLPEPNFRAANGSRHYNLDLSRKE